MMSRHFYPRIFLSVAVLALAVFLLFYKLGDAPLRIWDESLFAMRAYHMAEMGGYLSNFDQFPGITFYRNLKPPFGTWFQALSFRYFGYSEWALRFPVAIFASLLMLWLILRGHQMAGQSWAGVLAVLILLGSPGFFRDHVARTGDHDAILLLWMMAGLWLCQMLSLPLSPNKRRLYLLMWVLTLFVGFLTKSFFAWMMVPACLVFWIWKGRFSALWRDPFSWGMALLLGASVGLYYWSMERAFPGFIQFESDTVLGRYVKVQDNHQLPWNYYIHAFFASRFFPWWWLLPIHLYLLFRVRDEAFRSSGVLLWLAGVSHLAIITGSTTKLDWYDAPLFPIASLMAGAVVGYLMTSVEVNRWVKGAIAIFALYALLVGLGNSLRTAASPQLINPEEAYQPFMRYLQQERPDLKKYTIYGYEYNGQTGFTSRYWNDHYGYQIAVAVFFPSDGFEAGSYVITCSQEKADRLLQSQEAVNVMAQGGCELWEVKGGVVQ